MPNEACVYTLFGAYVGTARDSGFWWANPFRSKKKISLRARSMEVARTAMCPKDDYFKSMGLFLAACSLFFAALWGFFTNFPTICELALSSDGRIPTELAV